MISPKLAAEVNNRFLLFLKNELRNFYLVRNFYYLS